MLYRLIFLCGPRTGDHVTIPEEPLVIGRSSDCGLVVPDLEMARRHAVVEQRENELHIRDLGSMNRILINKREARETRLKHGDEIEIGRTRLVVQALLQAEVEPESLTRRRYRAAWAIAAILLVGVVLALSARYVPREVSAPAESLPADALSPTAAPEPEPSHPETPALVEPPSAEEIKILRNDILAIQDKIKTLTEQSTPAPATSAAPPAPPAPSSGESDAASLFEAAQTAGAKAKWEEADALLARVQKLDPDFLDAYQARATALEQLGRKADAAAQWSEVLRRGIDTPLYRKAVAERIRLSEQNPTVTAANEPVWKLDQVLQNRFRAAEDYAEMRILHIALAPARAGLRPDRDAVQVEVIFYDRDLETGTVRPTEARVSQETGDATATWGMDTEKSVSATYVVPAGLRERQYAAGRPQTFYGYRVRLFHHGRLQDEVAVPRTLASLPEPETLRAETAAEPAAAP